ncbi:hypothetical protein QYM41_08580 [Kocuria sp. CPCC 205268]|uniref:hypothetical protein n=1 Tax=Kocuria oxytropis TaxID=3058913 RepID=UPI0034D397B5
MRTRDRRTARMLAAGMAAVAGIGLAGCGSEGPESGTDVEDVTDGEVVESSAAATEDAGAMALAYEGDYNQDFYDDVTTYTGQQVTLSAEVSETISPDAFAIAGAVDPLLIVESQEIPPLDDGQVVQVTGTVQEGFDVVSVEEELGVDLEDEAFADFEGDPYIMATSGEVLEQE